MEATGVYYIRLAFFLDSLGCKLSVVNAMSIKRYIQMHLGKQALIAVMNKLLKQVFAVVKNNSLYQPNYCSTLH